MTGARLIVVGVDDDPGFATRARRLGADWVAKERAAAVLPACWALAAERLRGRAAEALAASRSERRTGIRATRRVPVAGRRADVELAVARARSARACRPARSRRPAAGVEAARRRRAISTTTRRAPPRDRRSAASTCAAAACLTMFVSASCTSR